MVLAVPVPLGPEYQVTVAPGAVLPMVAGSITLPEHAGPMFCVSGVGGVELTTTEKLVGALAQPPTVWVTAYPAVVDAVVVEIFGGVGEATALPGEVQLRPVPVAEIVAVLPWQTVVPLTTGELGVAFIVKSALKASGSAPGELLLFTPIL